MPGAMRINRDGENVTYCCEDTVVDAGGPGYEKKKVEDPKC